MLESILDLLKSIVKSRLFTLVVAYILLFSVLVGRMFYLQIIKGEDYDKEAALQKQKIKTIKSARGKIYDCTGKLLATNEQTYAITMEDSGELTDNPSKNRMILRCIQLLEKNGDNLELDFPIIITKKGKMKFNVSKSAELRFKRDIFYAKSVDELSEEKQKMNAKECFEYIRTSDAVNTIRFFNIAKDTNEDGTIDESERENKDDDYSVEDTLKIMTVRYALMMNTYSKYEPIKLSSDVSEKTVAAIKENSADLPGVEVSTEMNRVYYDSKYFAHIIGYTGLISSETLVEMQENNPNNEYTSADQIGKTGIEKEYENQLKGSKGSETLWIDSASRVVSKEKTKDAVAGNDIYLSINADLQKATYKLAEKQIAGILTSKLVNSKSHGTKGKKASGILVSIYDVYDAIIQNSIIDVTHFSKEDATDLEKTVYESFSNSKTSAINSIQSQLTYGNKTPGEDLTDALDEYLDYIFSMLRTNGVLNSETLDTTHSIYQKYVSDKCSLSEFLINAIKNNWINLDTLELKEDYYSSEEVFQKICEYVYEELSEDTAFDKKVYHVMVDRGTLTGRVICLLLYDQKVLKKNQNTYAKLQAAMISPYEFLKSKIRSLEISPGELGLTPCACSVVITDVKTGKVLALVSYPSYDNNKFANTVDSTYYSKISTSSASALMNRATQQKTAPGSTYKPLISIAGISENVINTGSTIGCSGEFKRVEPHPKCWYYPNGHGSLAVAGAIEHSCNCFFYEVGYRLSLTEDEDGEKTYSSKVGTDTIAKYASMFGLNETSGIEIPEAEPQISDETSIPTAIGQGTNNYTTSQLARYVTAVANKGTVYSLTLLDKVTEPDGKVIEENEPEITNQVEDVSETTWNAIHEGMRNVVKLHNMEVFRKLNNSEISVSGKTGTAQQSKTHPDHGLFVGFAPSENPEIAFAIRIANGYSSARAAEVGRDVMLYYYDLEEKDTLITGKAAELSASSSGD